ncbi:tetratricopeptide repeat protein [Cupriavidus sp. 8B]
MQLDESIYTVIKRHCAEGDRFADERQYRSAVGAYNKAWELIPAPKNDWEASTWILAAIGDACFLGGHPASSKEAFTYALTCPGGLGNPFIHLRLGQLSHDAGNLDAAADELMRAYMGAGEDIFAKEDVKYLLFLRTRAVL